MRVKVADQFAAERLMQQISYQHRRLSGASTPTHMQVAMVLHALADHTAIMSALQHRPDATSPWPEATSIGRWLHDVADDMEAKFKDHKPTAAADHQPYYDPSYGQHRVMTQQQQMSSFTLYEELKLRGVDMSWYACRKHPKLHSNIPLENERCSRLSIYLLKRDGSLWSVKYDGEAYSQVRDSRRAVPRDLYVRICCKARWPSMPADHKGVSL